MSNPIISKLKNIRAMIFDVDGVLTNGKIMLLDDGEWLRQMNMKDGLALKMASDARVKMGVISGSGTEAVRIRLAKLGFSTILLGVELKIAALESFIIDQGIHHLECLYMGDDINDLECMAMAGFSCCPADAVGQVREKADYVSRFNGGNGAVREIVEMTLRAKELWPL